jgi:hypothetical protein
MIDQSVHTTHDVDIGDIDALSREFIVVKRGYLNEHYYYIPITKVEGWAKNKRRRGLEKLLLFHRMTQIDNMDVHYVCEKLFKTHTR